MNYFIGIDVGTSGTKSVLFDENGKIIRTASAEYELIQPHNGWAEQNPLDWKTAAFYTIKELTSKINPEEIKGIGVSGQMHGLVMLDKAGNPLHNSLIWCDQRTENEVKEIETVIGKERYIDLTLNAPNTSFTLSKLLWVKNNLPNIYNEIDKVLLPKDYINYCLTGKATTDVSDAGGTGYFDVKNKCWSLEILKSFNINSGLLAPVLNSCANVGFVSKDVALKLGLSEKTVVVAGAGDQAAAALGNGIIEEGDMSISLGTSGVVFSAVKEPIYDKKGRIHTFCHAVPGMWHVMGVTQGCGLSLSWFKHRFCESISYKVLDEKAEKVKSDGVMFLPYLMGERTPHLDPNCRAAFIGLSASHTSINMYRAVLEGVCFSLKDCYEIMCGIGLKANKISVSGGGANSPLWLSILADTLSHNISKNENSESGARGVAMLAAVGSGVYETVKDANKKMNKSILSNTDFSLENINYYNKLYPVYSNLYHVIKESNDKLILINKGE